MVTCSTHHHPLTLLFRISNSDSKIILTHQQRQHRKPLLQCRLAILQRAGQGRDWFWKWSGHWFASTIPLPTLLPQNPIHSSPIANRQEKLRVVWLGQREASSWNTLRIILLLPSFRMPNSDSKIFFCKPSTASALKQCRLAGFERRAQPFWWQQFAPAIIPFHLPKLTLQPHYLRTQNMLPPEAIR